MEKASLQATEKFLMNIFEFQNLGTYLKEKRIETKLTQAEVSEYLKVHPQYISNWERGICAPPSHCLQHALDLLGADRKKVVELMVLDSKKIIESKIFKRTKKKTAA